MVTVEKSNTTPSNSNSIWIDTSVNPPLLKIFSTGEWKTVGVQLDNSFEGKLKELAESLAKHEKDTNSHPVELIKILKNGKKGQVLMSDGKGSVYWDYLETETKSEE
jgi:hypothetical protein